MAVPIRVQSSSGTALTTGTITMSLAGCTRGNVILSHVASRGVTEDFTTTNIVNIEDCNGTDNALGTVVSGSGISPGILHQVGIGRVMADGTVSIDLTVGASGEDLFAQLHEFTACTASTTQVGALGVHENGSSGTGRDVNAANSTTPNFNGSPIIANRRDRLGVTLTAIASNQAMSDWSSETGGYDLTEATEFQSATGATCTLQLQTGAMSKAGTCDAGTQTLGAAVDWVTCTFALNGDANPLADTHKTKFIYIRKNK